MTSESILLSVDGKTPQIAEDCYVAPGAAVVAEVALESEATVWFGAVLRGDDAPITVGRRTNVQDNAVVHADPDFPTVIGADVTIGHGAIVHGATLEDRCLVGMGAVVMNGAVIGAGALVAGGAVVSPDTRIPPGMLAVGVPAKAVREVTDAERTSTADGVETYRERGHRYARGAAPIRP